MRTPLGILEKVRPVERGVDFLPLALALTCAALVAVLASNFVYAPGMYVGFDNTLAASTRNLTTPKTNVGDMARTATTVTLISARGPGSSSWLAAWSTAKDSGPSSRPYLRIKQLSPGLSSSKPMAP